MDPWPKLHSPKVFSPTSKTAPELELGMTGGEWQYAESRRSCATCIRDSAIFVDANILDDSNNTSPLTTPAVPSFSRMYSFAFLLP